MNLIAFPTTLINTWRNLLSSISTYIGRSGVKSKINCKPFLFDCIFSISSVFFSILCKSKVLLLSVTSPTSIFDICRILLIKSSKCSPLRPIIPKYWCWSASRTAARVSSWQKPRIALRGVRNSWLIFERNSLFALLALSASSLAFCRAISACFRSVISLAVPVVPVIFPAASKRAIAFVLTSICLPSFPNTILSY